MNKECWHEKSHKEVIDGLNSTEYGLTSEEAKNRLVKFGENALPEEKVEGVFKIFLRQFQSPLIYTLLSAAAIMFLMEEIIDGSIVLAVLLFNAVVGSVQEGRAQNTLLALRKFVETKATVLRDGREIIIRDTEIIPGDIIILQEGEKIPADARVLISNNLRVDEAALTGESEPVYKISEQIFSASRNISDERNMVFKGTNIVAGNGRAIIVATGKETAIGKIAVKIKGLDTEIPLKSNIRYLSRLIIIAVAMISASIFTIGILMGKPAKDMFGTVVSLAVSVIPEGLPIVVTLILAMGVWRMGKRNALVKKLQAVEALGQARVIAVDKTGTITKNEMVVREVYVNASTFSIGGSGYDPGGDIRYGENIIDAANHPDLLFAGKIAAYCSSARVMYSEEDKLWRVSGDPTEAAMLVLGQKVGFYKDKLEGESPLVAEIPFDYKLKYHATLHKSGEKNILSVVGAPEVIMSMSETVWLDGKKRDLTKADRKSLEDTFFEMSDRGLRIVALAFDPAFGRELRKEKVGGLTFVGFYGMQDALRPEVGSAIRRAVSAGIRVVMITGDHKITARAIAKEAGIYHDGDIVLTGAEIDGLSDGELSEMLSRASVFARVTPEHKLRIIKSYRARNEVVAMTGDGVNDAPSLVAADLGIAMGKIGTEVAKEASDIVLLDDNFESIVSAIEEGRGIYKTIKKVVLYLFSTSAAEVGVIAGALVIGLPLPLLPAQIIWLNFVTDGFLDVSLAAEPKEDDLLKEKFDKPKKYIVDNLMTKRMAVMSLTMIVGSLLVFNYYFTTDLSKSWTASLTVLAAYQWFNAWNCRSETKSIFQINPFSNKFLLASTFIIVFLQLVAVYTPVMQKILRTVPLEYSDWLIIIPVAGLVILTEEMRKFIVRKSKAGFGEPNRRASGVA